MSATEKALVEMNILHGRWFWTNCCADIVGSGFVVWQLWIEVSCCTPPTVTHIVSTLGVHKDNQGDLIVTAPCFPLCKTLLPICYLYYGSPIRATKTIVPTQITIPHHGDMPHNIHTLHYTIYLYFKSLSQIWCYSWKNHGLLSLGA